MRDIQYLEIFTDETMCLLQKNLIKAKLSDDIDETRFFFFLAVLHIMWESQFPVEGSNLQPLHWKRGVTIQLEKSQMKQDWP